MWDKITHQFPNLKSHPTHCDACINFEIMIESRLIHISSRIQTFKLLVHMAISTYTFSSITFFINIWHYLVASLWNIFKIHWCLSIFGYCGEMSHGWTCLWVLELMDRTILHLLMHRLQAKPRVFTPRSSFSDLKGIGQMRQLIN